MYVTRGVWFRIKRRLHTEYLENEQFDRIIPSPTVLHRELDKMEVLHEHVLVDPKQEHVPKWAGKWARLLVVRSESHVCEMRIMMSSTSLSKIGLPSRTSQKSVHRGEER